MKISTRKFTGLVVLTALLGMPLTQAVANETMTEVQEVISDYMDLKSHKVGAL
ncbi:MAG TPA: hypothetical protein VJY57_03620 [Thiopseudomonas sp.]|nr:hypothetical protein [Thiopseudomonas sp.]